MTLERSTQARLTTALVLLLVLGAGVVLGLALGRWMASSRAVGQETVEAREDPELDSPPRGRDLRSRGPTRGSPEPGDSARRRPPLIVDQVGLSEAQKNQVDSIVGHFRDRMKALHDEFDEVYSTRYREITQATRDEIRGVLTPEQRTAYDSLLVEWDERRRERRDDSGKDRNRRSGGD